MSHDIYSYDQRGQILQHVRFTMGDTYAPLFYDLFDAHQYNGGVSGIGATIMLSPSQVEEALERFMQLGEHAFLYQNRKGEIFDWQQKAILKFIKTCLEIAREEGKVEVAFA
ncbi:hypothetical protein MUB24_14205 [Lederbergia sp. NSJ-179]|uniref:hypothetical protein n=1 Tax=Lederbergia sp. NSJ-179 TaxID=2931402 RepID=UPI001FD55C29|nr:hypothetical protein [Lederbergia sp. NSJ-179]MCJ7842033.1 hypothetical protein [Lederbergia sp. NSJ-179]